ncbi:hypothetical protein DPX16_19007 [Anabarilius grahami]|uniref:Uncharacterized protein n=1 Tax=Anabarilius grahami TaxID=495550 RepID=A0A3N0YLZ2_ANAGA|nr:hypothetical protein DPX16_19007 [Anabarilius grahami]
MQQTVPRASKPRQTAPRSLNATESKKCKLQDLKRQTGTLDDNLMFTTEPDRVQSRPQTASGKTRHRDADIPSSTVAYVETLRVKMYHTPIRTFNREIKEPESVHSVMEQWIHRDVIEKVEDTREEEDEEEDEQEQ